MTSYRRQYEVKLGRYVADVILTSMRRRKLMVDRCHCDVENWTHFSINFDFLATSPRRRKLKEMTSQGRIKHQINDES